MSVYVDDVRHPYRGMIMCHLWADTLEELFDMVDRIGVDRCWLQGHPTLSRPMYRKASWVHFDISLSKKVLALKHGAKLRDKYGPSLHVARLERNERMIRLILAVRRKDRLRKEKDAGKGVLI